METTPANSQCTPGRHIGDAYSASCPCRDVLNLVASKWSALIMGRLEDSPFRFGELRRSIPGVTQKMLTQTLRRLETDGLVHREVLPARPPRVEYSLTALGQSATEPLRAIREWSEQHLPEILAARERAHG